MAAIQESNSSFRILFRYLGKQYTFPLGEATHDEAQTKAAQVDYFLLLLKQGFVHLPPADGRGARHLQYSLQKWAFGSMSTPSMPVEEFR